MMWWEVLVFTTGMFSAPPAFRFVKGRLPKTFTNLFKKREDWEASLKEGELLPGVTKPSTTLAHMIAAKLLKDDFTVGYKKVYSKEFSISWDETYDCMIKPDSISTSFGVSFDVSEKEILKKAIEKLQKLDKRRKEIAAAAKNQEAALSVIEKVMGIQASVHDETCTFSCCKEKKPKIVEEFPHEILSIQEVKR